MSLSSKTAHELKYGGEQFNFCSDECRHKFEKDPASYTHKSIAAMAHSAAEIER